MFPRKASNSVVQFLTKLQCVNKWSKSPKHQISTNLSITKHNRKQGMSKQLSVTLLLQPSSLFLTERFPQKKFFNRTLQKKKFLNFHETLTYQLE